MYGLTFLAISFNGIAAAAIPLILAATVSSVVYFGMKAWHKKKHPDDEYSKESAKQKKEREKLKNKTMNVVTNKLSGTNFKESDSTPNGLRSGKYKKKKKK